MRIYGYLRASTKEQDAFRAKESLNNFVKNIDKEVSGWFVENESGATLKRPELFRLLEIAQKGDVLLVEQVDRISRLNSEDWEHLKNIINSKSICIVSLDLPTSHQFVKTQDEFSKRMLSAVNSMLLDMLSAIARKDYEDRRRRQKQGIEIARKLGKYKGRGVNNKLHSNITSLLRDNKSYSEINNILGCSFSTISKVKKQNIQNIND